MNDNLRDELGRALHQQADGIGGTPISFDDVRGTAGRIRNRRRAVVAGAVLAVGAAVAAPTVILGGLGDDRGNPPVVTPPADPRSASYLDLSDDTAHGADGSVVDLDVIGSSTVALPDGRIVTLQYDGGDGTQAAVHTVTVLGPDGKRVADFESASDTLAWTPSGDAVTWVAPDGTPMVLRSGEADPMRLARIPDAQRAGADGTVRPLRVGGFNGSTDCTAAGDGVLDGCTVIVQVADSAGDLVAWESSNVNEAPGRFETEVLAVAPDGDLFVRRTGFRDGEVCAATFRRSQIGGDGPAVPLGEVCINENVGFGFVFSPDSGLVAAQHGEGYGPTATEILDAETLEPVASATGEGESHHEVLWLDGRTVFFTVDHDQRGMEHGEYELQWLRVLDGEVTSGTLHTGNLRLLSPGSWSPPGSGPSDDPTEPGEATGTGGLDIRDLPTGDAPRIAWLEGTTLHRADGSTATLPKAYTRLAAWGDHWVAIDGRDRVDLIADDGLYVVDTWQAFENAEPVTNAEGSNVAWMGADSTVRVLAGDRIVPIELGPFDFGTQLVAITGDCGTSAETTVGGGCRVFANVEDAGDSIFLAMDNHTRSAEPASRTIVQGKDVVAAPGGQGAEVLLAGITEFHEDLTTCSALTGPHSDSPTWTTCDFRPFTFSPDGSKLLAHESVGSGSGVGEVAILDAADGTPLVSLDNHDSQAFANAAVWEDDSHLLVTVFQDGRWAMVRIGVDGSLEYAVEPRPGEDVGTPYFFATRP